MENTKRARKEKSGIRPNGETCVEPKDLLSGLEGVPGDRHSYRDLCSR